MYDGTLSSRHPSSTSPLRPSSPGGWLSFFFNDTATTEIYTLSLHDALPISPPGRRRGPAHPHRVGPAHLPRPARGAAAGRDRKSTRLNSSHPSISYAVFCLKKKTEMRSLVHVTTAHRCLAVPEQLVPRRAPH